MQIIIFALMFFIGYLYRDYTSEKNRKKLVESSNKIFELNSYIVMVNMIEMHNLGLKALSIAYEKCLEVDQAQKEEYTKMLEIYDRKMNEFGEGYMKRLREVLPHKLKYNTYKQVKENINTLINNKQEEQTDVREITKTAN